MKTANRLFSAALFLMVALAPVAALAQSAILQASPTTAGHAPMYSTSGGAGSQAVAVDSGPAGGGQVGLGLSETLQVNRSPLANSGTGPLGAHNCLYSAPTQTPSYRYLCFDAFAQGGGLIAYGAVGTSPLPLTFNINGATVSLPVSGGGDIVTATPPFNVNDAACWSALTAVLIDCGLNIQGGVVTAGTWNGTPISIAFGGTGATSVGAARTALGLGTMATQNASAVSITGGSIINTAITGVANPINPTDAANKQYVDLLGQGLRFQLPVRLATAAVLPNSPTYSNGASGVGATLTAGSNTTLTVDSTTANLNDRILVTDQASALQNGCYVVTAAGSGSVPWVLTRCTDFDTAAEMLGGSYFFIQAGASQINTSQVLQATVTTVGTTAAVFVQFSTAVSGVASFNTRTGAVTLTQTDVIGTGQRESLQSPRTYYVRTDGNDACNGMTDAGGSSGNCAFATPQKAINVVQGTIDFGPYNVTIQVRAGTYTGGFICDGFLVGGSGTVTLVGDTTTPSNVVFSTTNTDALLVENGCFLSVGGFKLTATGASGNGLRAYQGGFITMTGQMEFGAAGAIQIEASGATIVNHGANYTISGGAQAHLHLPGAGVMDFAFSTVTLTGTPAFSSYFIGAAGNSVAHFGLWTWNGAATGTRFFLHDGAGVLTPGISGNLNFFPGNGPGLVYDGAQYDTIFGDVQSDININQPSCPCRLHFEQGGAGAGVILSSIGDDTTNVVVATNTAQNVGAYMPHNTNTWLAFSDVRLKSNIKTLSVLSHLDAYRAVTYTNNLTGLREVGVVAQEQIAMFPELVKKGDDDPTPPMSAFDPRAWGIAYDRYGPIALMGVKELRDIVTVLQDKLSAQDERLTALERLVNERRAYLRQPLSHTRANSRSARDQRHTKALSGMRMTAAK